ncbi:MAG: hypothetical protein ACTSXX_04420, partial [Candidatus Baldrarchaeia archaeon]
MSFPEPEWLSKTEVTEEEREKEGELREIKPKDFIKELKTIVDSVPVRIFDVIGEEAKDFKPLSEVAGTVAEKLGISADNAATLLKLLIMLRLVEYDEVEDRIRSIEPISRFIARMKWG